MLHVDAEAVHAALGALKTLAADLNSYQQVLLREISSLDRMKDGGTLLAIKQDIRRINRLIGQVSRSAEQLHQAALAGLDILMDCERGIIALAREIDTGKLPQPAGNRQGPVVRAENRRQYIRVSEDSIRFSGVLMPGWFRRAARTYFSSQTNSGS